MLPLYLHTPRLMRAVILVHLCIELLPCLRCWFLLRGLLLSLLLRRLLLSTLLVESSWTLLDADFTSDVWGRCRDSTLNLLLSVPTRKG